MRYQYSACFYTFLKIFGKYGCATLASLLVLHGLFDFPIFNWNYPVSPFTGDTKEVLSWIVNFLHHDFTELLAAPFGYEDTKYLSTLYNSIEFLGWSFQDYMYYLLSLIDDDPVFVANGFYFMSFPLVTLCFVYAAMRIGISYSASLLFGICYSFLFYHLARGIHHLSLSCYALVPFYILVLVWLAEDKLFKKSSDQHLFSSQYEYLYKVIFCAILFLVLAPVNHHYLYFFIMLIPFAFVFRLVNKNVKKSNIIFLFFVLILAIFSMYRSYVPDFIYKSIINPTASEYVAINKSLIESNQHIAAYGDTEIFGLKVTQLLLPVDEHRIGYFADIKKKYNLHHETNENTTSALGLIGSIVFIVLIGYSFYSISRMRPYILFAILMIACVFIGSIGGVGTLLQVLYFEMPFDTKLVDIRSYNRISVYIACLIFISLGAGWDHLWKMLNINSTMYYKLRRTLFIILSIIFAIIIILDQTPSIKFKNIQEKYNTTYQLEKDYISEIEDYIGEGSIFQLPHVVHHNWPSHTNPQDNFYYTDMYTGYIFSRKLKWSFGADENTPQNYVYEKISQLPVKDMVQELRVMRFSGIMVDTAGYHDLGEQIVHRLMRHIPAEPIMGGDHNRYVFFPLPELLDMGYTSPYGSNAEQIKEAVLENRRKPCVDFTQKSYQNKLITGWHGYENGYRWTRDRAVVELTIPPYFQAQKILIEGFTTKQAAEFSVFVDNNQVLDAHIVPDYEFQLMAPVNLKWGNTTVRVTIQTTVWVPKEVGLSEDPRELGIAIRKIELHE
ncbi:MAG: hypothetical protein U5L00_13700 [Desulfovermiculus sp.]|nr:hypothetical protein [Desulfovermiculus sp.]